MATQIHHREDSTTVSDSLVSPESRSETKLSPSQPQVDDLPIEDLIFPQLLREGIAQRCTYCILKTGSSVNFTSLGQYAKHVLYNHEGYSIYVFKDDLKRYKKELALLRKKQRQYPKEFRQPKAADNLYYIRRSHPFSKHRNEIINHMNYKLG